MFTFSDGGTTALDCAVLPGLMNPNEQPLVVVIIPGLYSDSKANPMITLVEAIIGSGARAYVVNYRGMAGLYFRVKYIFLLTIINTETFAQFR